MAVKDKAVTRFDSKKLLAVGTGVGVRIHGDNLDVTIARLRGREARVVASARIEDFRNRPAGEWGAEYASLLSSNGAGHLAATVVLPRSEVIIRQLDLPGVRARDLDSAVQLQVDSLHPYPEDGASCAWAPLKGTSTVLVSIARREVVERYALLFAEAGIRVASLTPAAPIIHSAIRLRENLPSDGVLVLLDSDDGLEAYGESPARNIFSSVFDLPPEEAASIAAAELRVDPDAASRTLRDLLPIPRSAEPEAEPISYAAALAAACPWLALPVNLLPAEQRATSSRAVYAPTAVLAAVVLVLGCALAVYATVAESRYRGMLQAEIDALTPQAAQVRDLDDSMNELLARRDELYRFRNRTRVDLDAIEELTRILEPPIWARSLRLNRNTMQLTGHAPQAAPLLEVIDSSPMFSGSQFTSAISQDDSGETFVIRSTREAVTP